MSTVAARLAAFLPFMDSGRSPSSSQSNEPSARTGTGSDGLTADERDIIWMMRVRGGDRQAFELLVECHQQRVVGTVARMLGADSADAEDVGQQVFLRVWRSAARYEPTAKFTTWLYTIVRNLVFNELRRRKGRPTTSLDAAAVGDGESGRTVGEAFGHLEDAHAPAPDATLLEGELQAAIAEAIGSLPETQRMALVLRRYEDLSYEEIAETLGQTVPAVKSLLFRARTLLREKLGRYLDA